LAFRQGGGTGAGRVNAAHNLFVGAAMGIITISRQIGAGETAVAPAVAERLGWECIDKKLLDREVEETGVTIPYVVHDDEHVPGLVESLQHPRGGDKYFHAVKRIVREFGDRGNIVIVGRGTNWLLRKYDALHIRLVADMRFRIQRVMEYRWVNEGPARQIIHQSDHDRAAFHRRYFKADWDDPLQYHLVLNTSELGIDAAVDIVVGAARSRWAERNGKS
jgi:cytidylate kinase